MLRVFHAEAVMQPGVFLPLSKEEGHHLVRVRRARPGDVVEILDGRGGAALGTVEEAAGKSVTLRVDSVEAPWPRPLPIRLCLAFPRSKVFESVLQKCVELGVAGVQPLASDHADPSVAKSRDASRRERWQQILVEALKQSGNRFLPDLHEPVTLQKSLDTSPPESLRLCAALHPQARVLSSLLMEHANKLQQGLDLYIGPEGDFSAAEYEKLEAEAHFFTLGNTVLRVETAVVSVVAILMEAARGSKQDRPSNG